MTRRKRNRMRRTYNRLRTLKPREHKWAKVDYSNGVVFAWVLYRPCWQKRWL